MPARRATSSVVVVGGGIAGCTIAYELARLGAKVTLLERQAIGCAASGRNTGTLLQQSEPRVRELMQRSLEIYQELDEQIGLRQIEQLVVASNEADFKKAEERVRAIEAGGIKVEYASAADLRHDFSLMADDLPGGFVVEGAGLLDPLRSTAAFARRAKQLGTEIHLGQEVVGWVEDGSAIRGVKTAVDEYSCDTVVLATGPWLPELASEVPVSAGRGWLLRQQSCPEAVPWVIEETSWPDQADLGRAMRPPTMTEISEEKYSSPVAEAFVVAPQMDGGNLVGASLAPSLMGPVEGAVVAARIASRALRFAPGMATVPVRSSWFAHRPMTPDGLPAAGRVRENLFMHGGHGSLGVQSAPATARWLANKLYHPTAGGDFDWIDCSRLLDGRYPSAGTWIGPR